MAPHVSERPTHFLSTVIKGPTQSRLAFLSWSLAGLSSFVFRAQPSNQGPTHSSLLCELTRRLQASCYECSMAFFICSLKGLCDMGLCTLQMRKQSHRGQVDLAETTESRVGLSVSAYVSIHRLSLMDQEAHIHQSAEAKASLSFLPTS